MDRRRFAAVSLSFIGLVISSPSWATGEKGGPASRLVQPDDPVFGNSHGTVTIVDFYDLRCPPCRAMDPRFRHLLRADHDVRYIPVDYPILGASSLLGVQALFAAQQQGKYAALRAMLMTEARPPSDETLHRDAKALHLDWETMEFAMNGDAVARRVAANLARGQALDVTGIPTMFINGRKITGALGYDDLRSVVREARRQAARS